MALATHNNTLGLGIVHRIGNAASAALTAIARRHAYNSTRRQLSALSAHELADLGLSHATIDQAAFHAVYGVSR